MITATQIQDLTTFDAGRDFVLSVYLNLTPDRQIGRTYRVAFSDLLRQLELSLDEEARAALQVEAERVRAFLESEPPRGKGLAIFSCTPRELWQAMPLPIAVGESCHVGRRPYIRPLLDVLDEYERYALALVDKEKARLFTIFLGEIEEHEAITDYVPGKHDEGGWSQANYQRHHEAHVYWHLKRVADELSAFLRNRPFDRLILAGPAEATSELRRILPRPLRSRLVATRPAEMFASVSDLLEMALAVERDIERASDERLVTDLIDTVAAGGLAALGFAATLEAVQAGNVHQLVVDETLRRPGRECSACGYLTIEPVARCPICQAGLELFDDLIERAVERTLEEAGTVKLVDGEAARVLNATGEGIGAFLRYREA